MHNCPSSNARLNKRLQAQQSRKHLMLHLTALNRSPNFNPFVAKTLSNLLCMRDDWTTVLFHIYDSLAAFDATFLLASGPHPARF